MANCTCTFCWPGTGTLSVFVTVSQDVVCSWLLSLPLATKGWKWVICTLFHTHSLCAACRKEWASVLFFCWFFLHLVGVNGKQMNPDTLYPYQMFSGLLQILLKANELIFNTLKWKRRDRESLRKLKQVLSSPAWWYHSWLVTEAAVGVSSFSLLRNHYCHWCNRTGPYIEELYTSTAK